MGEMLQKLDLDFETCTHKYVSYIIQTYDEPKKQIGNAND